MKKNLLTDQQREELRKFGANTWFVEYLFEQYKSDPNLIPKQWQKFFSGISNSEKGNGQKKVSPTKIEEPKKTVSTDKEESQVLAGSAARILENMTASLSIPVATSQRTIPVKLLEENRLTINNYLKRKNLGKISFTHIIGWAIIKAVKLVPAMNNSFSEKNGKPILNRRKQINLGLAIDIEKKDGSHSLLVPNLKNADKLNFNEFVQRYDDLVERSRKGQIDPPEFLDTTISLTNPGTIGTVTSIPRLMIGQGTIVAAGAIQYPAEFQAMSNTTISKLGISKVMNITSTYDHRIIQGAESGMFLKEIHELLLGKDSFYEEVFSDLKIPFKPVQFETDYRPGDFEGISNTEETEKQARILQLINLYRVRGHLIASLDPLGTKSNYHPELDPASYRLTIWDLDRYFIAGGFSGLKTATLREILDILHKTYCEKIGVEYMHIQNPEEKVWLQEKMEPVKNTPGFGLSIKKNILKKLMLAETFEHYIHTKFIGHKRFSLEGSETLIPVLDFLLNQASENGIIEVVLGMAHRGRLNVLANIIGKSYESIFTEFEDIVDPNSIEGSGDVKYHLGAAGEYKTQNGDSIKISVAPNPSHLEWVNPVVEGIVRAKQTRMEDKYHKHIFPLLIHGDAAFAGQGIAAETLNLSQLSGYRTGGTIHIVINNQIGFTTTPEEARSSVYATDVAKMIQAPIFHVNGDDPEAALWVTQLALEYRQKYSKDVVIDLFGYRRHGHNEGDEPGFTQPLLYEKIKQQPSVMTLYKERLIKNEQIDIKEFNDYLKEVTRALDNAFDKIKKKSTAFNADTPLAVSKEKVEAVKPEGNTYISKDMLSKIINGLTTIPPFFSGHPKLKKFLEKRRLLLDGEAGADWALAESIAFGSLLLEGTPIRLSGQDSVRGTFSQRHLALTDMQTGEEYYPLNHLSNEQAKIEALDSLLSEAAILGFEYGYSTADPLALVLWEAQFGDFANGAQIIIDNFIVASFEKWNVHNNLVMLLPHGYEGQGPEHSSARLERFLILCAEENIQVCNVSTPAQYFHLLRRQMKQAVKLPLIIMTPKSLLRHPSAVSFQNEFTSGKFMEVIDDQIKSKEKILRVVITSGKLFYELDKYRRENNLKETAIVRIEQFYPYNSRLMKKILSSYERANDIIWVQEEPRNMGAWGFLSSRLSKDLTDNQQLKYIGRAESASPSVGSYKKFQQQQDEVIKKTFE